MASDLLDVLFDRSEFALCIVDRAGFIARVNPTWERCAGLTSGEVVARKLNDLLEDRGQISTALQQCLEIRQPVAIDPHAGRFGTMDGWWCGRVSPVRLPHEGERILVEVRRLAGPAVVVGLER